MVAYQHPSSLGALQRYKQATAIFKHTSRASNTAWYKDPLDLDYQWHIRHDGSSCVACFFDKQTGQWSQALNLPEALLQDPEQRKAFIATAIRDAQIRVPRPIGVIVYLANDFGTNEIKAEFNNPSALSDLRSAALSDPRSILEDASLDAENNSFRILPLPAGLAAIATTVTHSRVLVPLLDDIREVSETSVYPVVVKAVSAPLLVLMGLPNLITPTPGKSFVTILQYSWFTVLAFFNNKSDLMLVRTIQHKGIRRVGSLRSALTATCASLEMLDPDLYVIPLAEQDDDTIEARLRSVAPASQITKVRIDHATEALPEYCKEPIIFLATQSSTKSDSLSNTFTTMVSEGWAVQDFLPITEEKGGIYPAFSEMRLLRHIRRARIAMIFSAIAIIGYLGNDIFKVVRQPVWLFDESQSKISKAQVTKLTQEQQRVYHWNNMLADRSKGWASMELVATLAKQDRGLLIRTCSHTAKPDTASGTNRIGMIREWKISGFARDEAVQFLNQLNTRDGTDAFFAEIAEKTENGSYRPRYGNRNITINMRTNENSTFRLESLDQALITDESSYPYTFDLTISQRFESTDPMALNVGKAP